MNFTYFVPDTALQTESRKWEVFRIQIQGHKPSATAEKHYTVRPLDLLRLHHERIESWILEQANLPFTSQSEPGKLRAI